MKRSQQTTMRNNEKVSSIPMSGWSQADQYAWEEAKRPSQRLKKGGAASKLRPSTVEDLERRYGTFVAFLVSQGIAFSNRPAGNVTPELVALYVEDNQRRGLASVTQGQTIWKLKQIAMLLDPTEDVSWMDNVAKDLDLVAIPKSHFKKIVAPEVLIREAATLFEEGRAKLDTGPVPAAILMRNALMIALMTFCPIRLKSFAGLDLGESFVEIDGEWWIVLKASQTKSKRSDERPVPTYLNDMIETYLTVARPILIEQEGTRPSRNVERPRAVRDRDVGAYAAREPKIESGPLWISSQSGKAMAYTAIADIFTQVTEHIVGIKINPHLFRAIAATAAARHSGDNLHLGAAVLQHTSKKTTDEHYNRASSLRAGKAFAQVLINLT